MCSRHAHGYRFTFSTFAPLLLRACLVKGKTIEVSIFFFFFFCFVHGEETLNKSCKAHERYENTPLHKVEQQERSATLRLHDHQVNELCQFET